MTTQLLRILKKTSLTNHDRYMINTHIALSVKNKAVGTLANDQVLIHPEGCNLRVSAAELRLTHIIAVDQKADEA